MSLCQYAGVSVGGGPVFQMGIIKSTMLSCDAPTLMVGLTKSTIAFWLGSREILEDTNMMKTSMSAEFVINWTIVLNV